jgi:hypothetical protein
VLLGANVVAFTMQKHPYYFISVFY